MASGIIKVTPEKLISTASAFQQTGNNIQNITNQMTQKVSELTGSVWSGEAATAYVKKFNELQDDMQRMSRMINEHVQDLNTMAKNYQAAETANQNAANALAGDVII